MKIKQLTTLKHKLQWLLLLAALLGVSQSAWSVDLYMRGWTGWDDYSNKMTESPSGTYKKTIILSAGATKSFKIATYKNGTGWDDNYNWGTATINSCTHDNVTLTNGSSSGNISFTAGRAGSYTFTFTSSNSKLTVTGPWHSGNYILGIGGWSTSDDKEFVNGELTMNLSEGDYEFKVYNNNCSNNKWYGNTGTMTAGNCSNWRFQENVDNNCTLNASRAGDYTFSISWSGDDPYISVTYPGCTPTAPTVSTPAVTSKTSTTAKLGGTIDSKGVTAACGDQEITEYGVRVYNDSDCADVHEISGSPFKTEADHATGTFSVDVTGLSANNQYWYKPYATNGTGTGTVPTAGTFTTNKVFTSVTITPATTSACVSGTTKSLSSTASDADGTVTGVTFSYTSSDKTVAEVAANGNITAKKAGTVTITSTASKSGYDNFTSASSVTINVYAKPSSGFAATGSYNGGDATWGDKFADSHRSATLSTATSAAYYQWYGCNSDGSSPTPTPSNVAFTNGNTSSCTATFNLPGTYYFKCKAGCSSADGDNSWSNVVTVNVPYPQLGVAGPLFDGAWNYTNAGTSGLMTRDGLTWTKSFYCTFSGSDSKQFKVIQQYKGGTTTSSGWVDGNKINGATCSVTSITKPDGTAWASGSNFYPASGLSLASGDQVTLTVTMTGYNTYTVTLVKDCTPPTVKELTNPSGQYTMCSNGHITLKIASTQSGYKYQLYQNGVKFGNAVSGGGDKTFDVDQSGIYTAKAYYGSSESLCLTNMDGSITLNISTTPILVRSTPETTNYSPVTITSINSDIYKWQVKDKDDNVVCDTDPDNLVPGTTAYLYDQTATSVTFKGASSGSVYEITATTKAGCPSEPAEIEVNNDTPCN